MNIIESIQLFISNPNALWVLTGTVLLGLSSGVLGSFAFLRNRGLMGDVLAHSALPGICLAFLLTGSKSPFFFLIGATVTGVLASMAINGITRFSRIKEDTALGLTLSVFFGIGIVFLTQIQHSANGNQSGLDKFLFGQSASLVGEDVYVMGGAAILLLLLCLMFFKEFKLLCFDPNFGRSLGFPIAGLDFFLMLLLVIAVVIGLQAAGVVLVVALIVTPAAAARYWTERLDVMLVLSGILGAISGALGTVLSAQTSNLPTGPLIVLAATVVFLISMFFSPKRGLLSKWIRLATARRKVARESVLEVLYESMEETGINRVSIPTIMKKHVMTSRFLHSILRTLKKDGLIQLEREKGIEWVKGTDAGWKAAYDTVLNARMTEVWMMNESRIGGNIRDRDTGTVTENIPTELFEELWRLLVEYGREPRWNPYKHPQKGGETS